MKQMNIFHLSFRVAETVTFVTSPLQKKTAKKKKLCYIIAPCALLDRGRHNVLKQKSHTRAL